MKNYLAVFIALFTWVISAQANEPLWTDQQRLDQREMVCLGTVISVSKTGPIDKNNDLYLAVVEVSGMKKGKKASTGSKINVYYAVSSSGHKRCPAFAELTKGDKGTFYLRNITDDIKKELKIKTVSEPAFFLEMGSDVKKETTEPTVGGDGKPAPQP